MAPHTHTLIRVMYSYDTAPLPFLPANQSLLLDLNCRLLTYHEEHNKMKLNILDLLELRGQTGVVHFLDYNN